MICPLMSRRGAIQSCLKECPWWLEDKRCCIIADLYKFCKGLDTDKSIVSIYFLQNQQGYIKIGKSTDVNQRIKKISMGFPKMLKLLLCISETSDLTEKTIHEKFKRDRVKGEWFRPSLQLRKFIKENGGFDKDEERLIYLLKIINSFIKKENLNVGIRKNEELWLFPEKVKEEIQKRFNIIVPKKVLGELMSKNDLLLKKRKSGAPSKRVQINKKCITVWILNKENTEKLIYDRLQVQKNTCL